MRSFDSLESYKKAHSTFSLVATLPILLVIICLIGDIFIQQTLTFDEESGFSIPYTAGMLSSFSSLTLLLCSNTENETLTRSLPAAVDVVYAILMIICSSKSIKGDRRFFYTTIIAYLVDLVFLIPVSIISALDITLIRLRVLDYCLLYIIHVVGLAGLLYGGYLRKRLAIYEEKENIKP